MSQASAPHTGASQTGASQTGASQTGASQTGASQTGASQTGASQTGASQTGTSQSGASQPGAIQAGVVQAGALQTAASQSGALQADASRIGTAQTRLVAHHAMTPEAAAAKGILVIATQHAGWGRVSFVLRGNPVPDVRSVPGGIEVHLAPGVRLEMAASAQLRETGRIGARDDDGAAVAVIPLVCHCTPGQDSEGGVLRLDFHPDPAANTQEIRQQLVTAMTGADAKPEPAAKPASEPKPADKAVLEADAKPEGGTRPEASSDAATRTATTARSGAEATANASVRTAAEARPETSTKPANPTKPSEAEEMARLRAFLTDKLAKLNATPPQITAPAPSRLMSDAAASRSYAPASAAAASRTASQTQSAGPSSGGGSAGMGAIQSQAAAPSAPPQSCVARVDASRWRGTGSFTERLVALRAQAARSQAAAEDIAALAEFYLANGLGSEAAATASEALVMDVAPEARLRLSRDADIGSLMAGRKVSADSPLLANAATCGRSDAPLWRNLAAAAEGDAEGAARDPEVVAAAMRSLPEPMQRELAYRVVAAVGDNLDALRAMAGALRNAMKETPEDEARRFLLQARISGLTGDQAEYAVFLERAARFDMTAPGVIAKARLAAIRAAEDGPGAAHAETVLIDIARTYRHDAIGQQAAEQYAELRLRRHDYAAALAIADENAGPRGPHTRESNGASLVLRILRMLLVDPATTALPEPNERIALYLRYGGYTTPGEKGDDIRLAAARLMLAYHWPDAALDPLRRTRPTITAATPEASHMLATAEAYGGDPAKAMELAKALPDDIAAHRIAAEALRRMRQPLQAAHVLDGAAEIADRARRASLLFEAEAWPDAVTAYADVLHDPLLPASGRNDLATRYALAVAMSGQPASAVPLLRHDTTWRTGPASAAPGTMPALPPAVPAKQSGLSTLRGALERARRIETLLDPPTSHQGS